MHLLIILLQQLLGMLPGKKVPQPEVARSGNPATGSAPAGPEADAFARLRPPPASWMTPYLNVFRFVVPSTESAIHWLMRHEAIASRLVGYRVGRLNASRGRCAAWRVGAADRSRVGTRITGPTT
jgi:hypothetical protein